MGVSFSSLLDCAGVTDLNSVDLDLRPQTHRATRGEALISKVSFHSSALFIYFLKSWTIQQTFLGFVSF